MTAPRGRPSSREFAALRTRLAEAEDTLRAIRSGEVDAVVIAGDEGPRVFTLQGAMHEYRALIESMNEGALTMTTDKTILYANQCFARMVKCPLEQVAGGSFRRFLSAADGAALRALLGRSDPAGAKLQVQLKVGDGSRMPAQVSVRPVGENHPGRPVLGMVVTDMTEARRAEEMLRALTRRVVQSEEVGRARVALELHDQVTQLLYAAAFRSQALANCLSERDRRARAEAEELGEMLGRAADEVERVSRGLRPGALEQLGLADVLRSTGAEFAYRTGVSVKVACVKLTARLEAETELALYRVLQEALRNVEQHARARHVEVGLRRRGPVVQLSVADDGIGFDRDRHAAKPSARRGLGLLSMDERAAYVGGVLEIRSAPGTGTTVRVLVPFREEVP